MTRESFTTRQTKAQAIYGWFKDKPVDDLTYRDYKRHMDNRSNIVEYEDVLRLAHDGRLSVAAIMSVV